MTSLKQGIRNLIIADATYLTLMGSPTADHKNTFYMQPPVSPVYPETVFWIEAPLFNGEMDRDLLSIMGALNINVWAKDNTYESITDRLRILLHQKPVISKARIVLASMPQELYDQTLDAYGLNTVFNIYYRRALQ